MPAFFKVRLRISLTNSKIAYILKLPHFLYSCNFMPVFLSSLRLYYRKLSLSTIYSHISEIFGGSMSYEIFERLCNQNNTKPFHVSKATGVSTPTLTAWKNGQYTPKADKLQKIADYFGVSLEYLQTGKEKEKESTEGTAYYFNDETAEIAQELFENKELRLFFHNVRAMPPEDLAVLRNMAEALIRKEKHDH